MTLWMGPVYKCRAGEFVNLPVTRLTWYSTEGLGKNLPCTRSETQNCQKQTKTLALYTKSVNLPWFASRLLWRCLVQKLLESHESSSLRQKTKRPQKDKINLASICSLIFLRLYLLQQRTFQEFQNSFLGYFFTHYFLGILLHSFFFSSL